MNEIMTPVAVPDLVTMIANEVEARIKGHGAKSPEPKEENLRLIGDRALAEYLHCSIQTVNKLKRDGKLPFHRYGRKYYYLQSDIDNAFKGDLRNVRFVKPPNP